MFRNAPITRCFQAAFLLLASWSSLVAQDSSPAKPDDSVVTLEKFVAESDIDPSGFRQQTNTIFGLDKPALETPRSITGVSGDLIEKFNITNMSYLGRFSSSSYSSISFVVLSGVTIVRRPTSAAYGEGLVGGYINFQPRSALATTGKYHPGYTGKYSLTLDNWGGKIASAEVGGPLTVFGKKAGFYVYTDNNDSDTFYVGQHIRDVTIQGTFTIDLGPNLRFETGGSFYNHNGTGIAGWNRVTQALVDNRTYQTGMENFALIDTNHDGVASRAELYNAGLAGNYNFQTNGQPFPNQVKPGTTAYTAPGGPLAYVSNIGTVKLSPRNVLLERVNAGDDYVWFSELVNDKNPDLVFRNNTIFEHQNYHKLSDIAYFREGVTTMAEERATVEWNPKNLPNWLTISNVTAANVRFLEAQNKTTNVYQLFNYWDLTQFTTGHYLFSNGFEDPTGAGVDSLALSQHTESGLGNVLDINVMKKLDLTVGARYDYVSARLDN